jgi:hypothetical protein
VLISGQLARSPGQPPSAAPARSPSPYGAQVATIQLGLSLVFRVTAMGAGISAGRLVALHSGRCDLTAILAVQGTTVLTRQAHLMLPGVIPVSPGIRLLAAGDYPVSVRVPAPPSRWPDVVD